MSNMDEKYQQHQHVYPLAPSTIVPRSDAEASATYESMEAKRKKRNKRLAYFAAFVVFQTIVILVFALVVMKVKAPKVRFGDNIIVVNNGNGNIRLTAQVRIKNTNFGEYKFDGGIATLTSGGASVGQFAISDGKANMKSTKKVYIVADITNPSGSGTGSNSGVLEVTSKAKLNGKVVFMWVMKKKKSAEMDCTMSINLSTNVVQDMSCK